MSFRLVPLKTCCVEMNIGKGVPAQMRSSSLDCNLKLRIPSLIALVKLCDGLSLRFSLMSSWGSLGARMRHIPGFALHATVSGKCPTSPEDEQEKQGQSRDRRGTTRACDESLQHFSTNALRRLRGL
ncbi:hypothetical protein TNCV_3737131 [Trichonephila clavipes]|nr:hypothetical protein TNCV_3737131 [Trichonephila clavipes]